MLDCDAIYHQMLKTDGALRADLSQAFGDIFDEKGLNRQKLGKIVFSDPDAMEKLNGIINTHMPRELRRRMEGSLAPVIGIDAINLVESGTDRLCDCTVAVLAPAEDRIRRIMERDQIGRDYAILRVQAQKEDEFYRRHCTHVLMNNCASAEEFEEVAYACFLCMIKEKNAHE